MLAKCANPSCSALFRHFDEGRLFRLETEPTLRSSQAKAAEYFWLCAKCSAEMTLRLAQDGRVSATRLREAPRSAPRAGYVSVNHENGLVLRRVSFLRNRHPRGT
jgi:hypothetical protein